MENLTYLRLAFLTLAGGTPLTAASAQDVTSSQPDLRLASAPEEPKSDWQIQVGVGAFYGPAFLGSDDYQMQAGPNFEVRYKDRFFISLFDGIGFDLIKTENLRAGPIAKYQSERKENGKSSFVIAGKRTKALRGMGDVDATPELGGYVEYEAGPFQVGAEVRKGIGGHKGLIADIKANLRGPVPGMTISERPIMFSIGPRATIVDGNYNEAYFGIDERQSLRSGLRTYDAGGGLLSFGAGAAVIVPISDKMSIAVLGGYDRLSGDAAKSPLVRERGSRGQLSGGLGLIYRFGL